MSNLTNKCFGLPLIRILKRLFCNHKFNPADLKQTGILELEKPLGGSYEEWADYLEAIYNHDSHTKRVVWPCCKCGKVFYTHCGLDIGHDGNIVRTGH